MGGTTDHRERIRVLDAQLRRAYLGKAEAHLRVADFEFRIAAVFAGQNECDDAEIHRARAAHEQSFAKHAEQEAEALTQPH